MALANPKIKSGLPRRLSSKEPACKCRDARGAGSVPGLEGPLEEETAARSSILAWRALWTGGPGRLQSTGVTEDSGTTY